MAAFLPVVVAKRQAASTLGPIEPAGKGKAAIASGLARRIARWLGLPQSR